MDVKGLEITGMIASLTDAEAEIFAAMMYRGASRLAAEAEARLYLATTDPTWTPAFSTAMTDAERTMAAMREASQLHSGILAELARRTAVRARAARYAGDDHDELAQFTEAAAAWENAERSPLAGADLTSEL